MTELHRVLHNADLMVPGHALIWLRFEFSQTILDADGVIYHGIARYHAMTHTA